MCGALSVTLKTQYRLHYRDTIGVYRHIVGILYARYKYIIDVLYGLHNIKWGE